MNEVFFPLEKTNVYLSYFPCIHRPLQLKECLYNVGGGGEEGEQQISPNLQLDQTLEFRTKNVGLPLSSSAVPLKQQGTPIQ